MTTKRKNRGALKRSAGRSVEVVAAIAFLALLIISTALVRRRRGGER